MTDHHLGANPVSPPSTRAPSFIIHLDEPPADERAPLLGSGSRSQSRSDEPDLEGVRAVEGDDYDDLESGIPPDGSSAAKGNGSQSKQHSQPQSKWEMLKIRSKYYLPATAWIPAYSLSLFWGDLAAALTIASLIIPQSMSYATSLAKLNASTGLFAAAIPGIAYAFLGTCRQLNVGPEAALSLLVGQAVEGILHLDPHSVIDMREAIAVSTIITFQVGLISFGLGLFRLGFIDVVLSRALLRGFVTAVALVILLEQLIPMMGLEHLEHVVNPTTTFAKFLFLIENAWSHAHELTTVVSFGSLAALIAARMVKARLKVLPKMAWVFYVPEVFLCVVISTALSDVLRWDEKGVSILGSVTVDTHALLKLPLGKHNLKYLKATTSTAILIAVAGFLDSIVAAKQNSARFGYTISPNRELVALGAANLVSSFIPGTLPAYGAITRSKLNGDTGGRTQMASLMCSTLVILAVFYLLPALYFLPKCVLATIISLVVYSILAEAPHDVRYYWKMSAWIDFGLMLLTFFLTLVWSVEVGIIVSVTVSLLLVVRNSSKTQMKLLGHVPGTNTWKPVDEDEDAREEIPGVLIVRIRENLDFANTGQIKERLRRLEMYGGGKAHPSEAPRRQEAALVVFHMADVESMDASAAQIFLELITTYQNRGVQVHFAHVHPRAQEVFRKAGIIKAAGEDHFHRSVADAMQHLKDVIISTRH